MERTLVFKVNGKEVRVDSPSDAQRRKARRAAAAAGAAALALVLFLPACRSATGPGLEGGVLATFDVYGERFSIFVTKASTIDQIIALWNGQSNARIPNGRLRAGRVSYNLPWSWHIDPEEIEMAEATIELCDGTPSFVESELDYWLQTVGYYCPWGARLIALKDYR